MVVVGMLFGGCSDAADVVVVNRCAVDLLVRSTTEPAASPESLADAEPGVVAAGATVRFADAVIEPLEHPAEPGTFAVSAVKAEVGARRPLPYDDDADEFRAVIEGDLCP